MRVYYNFVVVKIYYFSEEVLYKFSARSPLTFILWT